MWLSLATRATIADKPWGTKQDFTQTTDFLSSTNLEMWGRRLENAEEEDDHDLIFDALLSK